MDTERETAPSDTQITIRRARPHDTNIIVSFNTAMAKESEDKPLDPRTVSAGVEAGISDPNRAIYFLAESAGEVVGQTMITTEWSDWRDGWFWWIQSVYVDPAHRRRGVFRALYEYIEQLARDTEDVCGLRLYVHGNNDKAIQTYKKLGMSITPYLLCEEELPGG